jgi:hypothetical protein
MLPASLFNRHSIDHDVVSTRRTLLLASLLLGLPAVLSKTAFASELDASETMITQRDAIQFVPWSGAPPRSGEMATLYGSLDRPGPYLVLMKWYPGYMSAPHFYATDRLSMVLSGTWWVDSGPISIRSTRCRFRPAGSSGGSPIRRILMV